MAELYVIDCLEELDFDGDYIFDTNVWIHIQSPYSNPYSAEATEYSKLYKHILEDGGTVHITPTIISEFVNHVLKTNFFVEKNNGNFRGSFKDYRQTQAYEEDATYVSGWLESFIADCQIIPMNYTCAQYEAFANQLGRTSLDFSDLIIVAECSCHNMTLVTHDKDFEGTGIDIISANRTYR